MTKQSELPKSATLGMGPDKNLLMEYIEKKPVGTVVVQSRFNPVGDRSDA